MKLPRLFWWIIATIILLATVLAVQPQQFPVTLYKISLGTLAGVVGYWFDRSLFPYARPDMFLSWVSRPAQHDGTGIEEFNIQNGQFTGRICDLDIGACDEIEVPVTADHTLSLIFIGAQLRRAFIVGTMVLAVGLGA